MEEEKKDVNLSVFWLRENEKSRFGTCYIQSLEIGSIRTKQFWLATT